MLQNNIIASMVRHVLQPLSLKIVCSAQQTDQHYAIHVHDS